MPRGLDYLSNSGKKINVFTRNIEILVKPFHYFNSIFVIFLSCQCSLLQCDIKAFNRSPYGTSHNLSWRCRGGGGGEGELGGPSIFVDGIWVWGGLTCQKMTLGGRGGLQVSFKY